MRYVYLALLWGFVTAYSAAASTPLRGRVVDAATGRALPGAMVVLPGAATATLSDSAGFFFLHLPPAARLLEVSSVGHRSKIVELGDVVIGAGLVVDLERKVIEVVDEIMVYGEKVSGHSLRHRAREQHATTDALLDGVAGVDMVRRANFALDPAIRGAHPGQVSVLIDGMKVFAACVDRMDPVTSYVETENLQKLEVAKGAFDLSQGQAVGGTINLVTQKPRFEHRLSGRAELGYESAAQHRYSRNMLNYARGDLALRSSFSYRKASDFKPGGQRALANTQYAKYNFKVDAVKKGKYQQITLGLLGDKAWDIGYPALLMDAPKAQSYIYSAEHLWTPVGRALDSAKTRLYFSRVDHWMGDESRDVSQREVMRDMHMPMFGKTRTLGVLENLLLAGRDYTLGIAFDFYYLSAFADMHMNSTLADVSPMYLLNLGDVRRYHLASAVDYNRALSKQLQWKTNIRLDVAKQELRDPVARRQHMATWGAAALDNRYLTPSVSSAIEYAWRAHTRFKLSLAHSARLPSQLESYGFFLFNPSDGYFYTGNSQLRVERSDQVELAVEYSDARRFFALSFYHNRMRDYIAGVVRESIFKDYANIANAYIYGAELSALMPLSRSLLLRSSASYTYGHNSDFDEPLPFMPPLQASFGLSYERERYGFDLSARLVDEQDRIAHQTTAEDKTPGFSVYDARAHISVAKSIELKLAVENIANDFYHEHLSVNNFPSPGRNISVALDFEL